MQNINLPSFIILAVGLVTMIFTIWNRITIRRHLRQFTVRSSSSLADDKYFELRSKQDYIIAVAAIIVSLASFFGYQGLQSIKDEINKELQTEKAKIESIKTEATSALAEYQKLKSAGHDYSKLLNRLKDRLKAISDKNIIQQNIYIVEKVKMSRFPADDSMYRKIYYKDLITIYGERLPAFSRPPSILCTSPTQSWPLLKDVTSESFRIDVENSLTHGEPFNTENILVDFWISQKPEKSFNSDFSDDFR